MSPLQELERSFFGRPLTRRMSWFFPEIMESPGVLAAPSAAGWVRLNVYDGESSVVVVAEVPGLTDKDVQLSFDKNVLTLTSERAAPVPEGYTAVRRERPSTRFTRAIRFGVNIDDENITAAVKDGLLTVTLPKVQRPAPRTIPVHA